MEKRKNHSPEFKVKVTLESIREAMTLAELRKKYGAYPTQIGTWKCAAIENMMTAFTHGGAAPEQVGADVSGAQHQQKVPAAQDLAIPVEERAH